jgi:uncharacterized protein YtpQ (UPF0354 family)
MPLFEHPLQLFTLEYPEAWQPQYQEQNGAVLFVQPDETLAGVFSVTPMRMDGNARPVVDEIVSATARLGLALDPRTVPVQQRGETQVAYAEGRDVEVGNLGPTTLRFWVVRHGTLTLYATQLGPGGAVEEQRRDAEAAIRSLAFPELLPPSPQEYQERVLDVLKREYPQLAAVVSSPGVIELTDRETGYTSRLALENLYRSALVNSESSGALIREYLDQVVGSLEKAEAYQQYDEVRDRLLPMLKSDEWATEARERKGVVSVTFAPGLLLCFAIDEPSRVAYVTREMVEGWDVPLERIQEVAQDNLARKDEELQMALLPGNDGRPLALVVNTRDGYDAARLAVPAIREAFAEELGDEYLVGLPNRDFLIAFSTRDPETVAGITRQVAADFHRMDHPLTAAIYRVRADQIEPWSG